MPILLILVLYFTCSAATPMHAGEGSAAGDLNSSKTKEPLSQQAKMFDRFVTGQLNEQELNALKESCKPEPNDNMFCLTVMNAELFEQRFKNKDKKTAIRSSLPAVIPRMVRKKVVNWLDLR